MIPGLAFVSAVLTAAGESTRMARPKPILPWRGSTLVRCQVESLLRGGVDEVVVVLGHLREQVSPHVEGAGARWALNPDYRTGRASSIRAGVAALDPRTDAVLLLGVDQPRPPEIVRAVLEAHARAGAPITAPRHRGRGGHPVVFAASLLPELARITEARQGVREVYEAHRDEVHRVEVDDPVVRLDLNTLEDYEAAVKLYGPDVRPSF